MTKQLEQGTQEWLDARKGLITGSRVGGIIGVNPYSSREDVMREMVRDHFGAEREFTGNEATEYGKEHEDAALQDFEIKYGIEVERAGLIVSEIYPHLAISPDGLIGADEGIEIKCPYSQKIKKLEDQPHYYAQVCLSLIVTGRHKWQFYTWTPDADSLEVVTYSDAEEWFNKYRDSIEAFCDEYQAIIADEKLAKPYLADLVTDLSDDTEWLELCNHYQKVKSAADEAKKDESEAKQALVEYAKTKETKSVKGGGVSVTQSFRKGNVQYAKIPELKGVDLERYRGKSTEVWSVR